MRGGFSRRRADNGKDGIGRLPHLLDTRAQITEIKLHGMNFIPQRIDTVPQPISLFELKARRTVDLLRQFAALMCDVSTHQPDFIEHEPPPAERDGCQGGQNLGEDPHRDG